MVLLSKNSVKEQTMYVLTLKKGEEKRADKHPWIFANTVQKIEGKDSQGSVAKVVTQTGRLVGYGFINHASKIIVRILTRDETPIDKKLFLEMLLLLHLKKIMKNILKILKNI